MRRLSWVIGVVFVFAAVGAVWANHCHEGEGGSGSHCPMEGCPGSGLKMIGFQGKVTEIAASHDLIKVKIGSKTATLRVHSECPHKAELTKQVAKLKVKQAIKGAYYVKGGKAYLCTLGDGQSCH